MELIGSGLSENLDERAALSPFIGGEDVRADLHLGDGVGLGREIDDAVARVAIHTGSIDLIFVCFLTLTGSDDLKARFGIEAIGALRP